MARTYKRDTSGRFSSNGAPSGPSRGGGGRKPASAKPSGRAKAAASLKASGGTLAARSSLKRSRGKLATNQSAAQRGAVTRAGNKLKASRLANQKRLASKPASGSRLMKRRGGASKPAAESTAPKRKTNTAAERAKRMADRTGVIPGSKFNDNKSVRTMSLRELRSEVIKSSKGSGKLGMLTIAQAAGTGDGVGSLQKGRMPRTRGEWEKAYRATVRVPMSDRNRRARPGVINGIDIHKNFRPWAVFGLNQKTATRDDVNQAARRLLRQVHPDVGGRAKDLQRVLKMRDSMLAFMPKAGKPGQRSASTGSSRGKKAASAPAASGPKLLPPARSEALTGRRRRKR